METVLTVALVAIAGVVVVTLLGMRSSRQREARGHAALADVAARGVEPVSLHPVVDPARCVGTGACVEACPEIDVIAVVSGQAKLANPTACIGHGECLVGCPVDAITLSIGSAMRGVDIPPVKGNFECNVPGMFIVGELGGMGLIYNAVTQALQCVEGIAKNAPAKVDGVHQLLIVGAGPAGLAASLGAVAAKLDYVTVDQESIGGTILQYPRQKVVMTRPVKLPLYGKLQLGSVSKEALLELWQDIIEKTGIEVRTGVKVEGITKTDGVFDVVTGAGTLRAQNVVLALGRRGSPRKLGVPGEDGEKVMYRLLEPENYTGTRCLVVGGGDSAVEAAVALGDNGVQVHLAYRRDSFGRIKPKNQQRLDESVAAGRVELLMKTKPLAIDAQSVSLERDGEAMELPNDFVLVFAGGVLPTAFLEKAGVEVRSFKGEAFAPANAR